MVYKQYEREGKFYSSNFDKQLSQVTYGTLQAFYISATYIGMWTIIQPKYYGLFYWILLIPAVFNVAKCFPYITKQVTLDNFDSGNQLSPSRILYFQLWL